MASGSRSRSRLRADAKPFMPAVEPAPVPPCTFPDGDDDDARMPAWLLELFEDPPIEEVAPGGYTPLLLPADENSSRAFVKKFISGHLSKVSKEVDESLVDYVNAFDPSQVAAQVEALLFERWGLFDLSKPVSGKYCVFLSRLADDGIKDLRTHSSWRDPARRFGQHVHNRNVAEVPGAKQNWRSGMGVLTAAGGLV